MSELAVQIEDAEPQALDFANVYNEYGPPLHAFILRSGVRPADAEDLLQDVMTRAWRTMNHLRDNGALKGWLYMIAKNVIIDYFRAKAIRPVAFEDVPREGVPLAQDLLASRANNLTDPHLALETSVAIESMFTLLGNMPKEQVRAFAMRHIQGASLEDIAEGTPASPNLTKWHIHNTRTKLSRAMIESGND